ncbi:unnamed protein product [Durusdinium trenchii]|uniref:Transmembrane protein 163 n=1 Tax=Durusdinium trenchii TaxID=1381693 RepID=A0ABP0KT08_9DINO
MSEKQSAERGVDPSFVNIEIDLASKERPSLPIPSKLGKGEEGQEEELENVTPSDAHLVLSARKVSLLSIFISLVLAILGFSIGLSENVLSVLGFGMEASLDGISSALVMWRFKTPKKRHFRDAEAAAIAKEARDARRERNSAVGIGATFVASAVLLCASAVWKLFGWDPATPEHVQEERSGALYTSLLAWPSAVIFGLLAVWKFRLSKQLGSEVLRKDALCSVLGALLALICALAAVLEEVVDGNPKAVAVVDATASFGIAMVLFFEGVRTLKHNLFDWETEHQELA